MTVPIPASVADSLDPGRLRGIGMMIAAFALFSMLDACAKYMADLYSQPQIIWARYAGHFLLALVMFWPSHGLRLASSNRLGLQVVRSGLLFTATCLNFSAVQFLQLAETSSIMFSIPLLVAALSVPLLGERVGPRRWAAIVIGFIGVLIVVRPGLGGMHWAAFLSVGSSLCAALYQITTRKLAGYDPAAVTQFYSALIGVALISPLAPFYWTPPAGAGLVAMIAIGLLGGVGHYLLILAHRLAPAPILAPFSYTQIVWMTAIGFIVFGDLPDRWTVAGGVVVVASGLYLLYRERRVKSAASR